MSYADSLLDIKKQPLDKVIAGLKDESEAVSKAAGSRLLRLSAQYGVGLRDYLTLAVDSKESGGLSGYEMCLAALGLPVRDDFERGIVLQAASQTFQTFPGTRAMFPEVIDDMLRWTNRQAIFETTGRFVAVSRTITQPELLSTVVLDDSAERDSFVVAETGRIPVRTIRTTEMSVKIWKHGSAIRTSYEFNRRASLDLLTPFVNRIERELELSKVKAATDLLINGDSVQSAAPVVDQSDLDTNTGATSVNGKITWENFLYWLVQRAKAGTPVDVIVGNWDSAFNWARMWDIPSNTVIGGSDGDNADRLAARMRTAVPGLDLPLPVFALSSTVPASKLIGITKGETIEELVEAGSNIEESERAILNQTITYVKTENTGYRLPFGDTRSIYNYGA